MRQYVLCRAELPGLSDGEHDFFVACLVPDRLEALACAWSINGADDAMLSLDEVTHWMELPEGPTA